MGLSPSPFTGTVPIFAAETTCPPKSGFAAAKMGLSPSPFTGTVPIFAAETTCPPKSGFAAAKMGLSPSAARGQAHFSAFARQRGATIKPAEK